MTADAAVLAPPRRLSAQAELILEVLAARYRLGETYWTFGRRFRTALTELEGAGLIWTRRGGKPDLIEGRLTGDGLVAALGPDYLPPITISPEAARALLSILAVVLGAPRDWITVVGALSWMTVQNLPYQLGLALNLDGDNEMPPETDTTVPSVDPIVAVDHALTRPEREKYTVRVLVGPFEGAEPADVIEQAEDSDAHLSETEPWWQESGDAAVAWLVAERGVTDQYARRLISAALYAALGIGYPAEELTAAVRNIASAAAVYALGHAEALSWSRGPHAIEIVWVNDEQVVVKLDGAEMVSADHDNDGWEGITKMTETATALAGRFGIPVTTTGTPNR